MELKLNDVVAIENKFNNADGLFGLVVEANLLGVEILWEDDEQMYYPNEEIDLWYNRGETDEDHYFNVLEDVSAIAIFHRKLITDMYMNR